MKTRPLHEDVGPGRDDFLSVALEVKEEDVLRAEIGMEAQRYTQERGG